MAMKYTIKLQELPIGKYNDIWFWLYKNDIGDMRKQADYTDGYVDAVTLSDEEAVLFKLKYGKQPNVIIDDRA
jgi:hypothetical protein